MKFRKITALLMAVAIIFSVSAVGAQGEKTVLKLQISSPTMTVNGVESEIDPGRGTVPVVESGRTLVPIRAIIEALGGNVGWDGEKSEVSLTYGEDIIKLVIGSAVASLNGVETTLDVAPKTINDRTMLPIRYIAESFNFIVEWDGSTSTVTITKDKITESESTGTTTPALKNEDDFEVFENPEDLIIEDDYSEFGKIEELNPEDEENMNPEDEEEEFLE